MRKRLVAALLVSSTASAAVAATIVEQDAVTTFGGRKLTTKHVWTVDAGRFRLAIQGADGEALYVFNGRNLYVCGKLDEKDRAFLSKNKLESDALVQRYGKGACQAAPSNFQARFFLSPALAAAALDRSDGMKVTLALDGHALERTGKKETVKGVPCHEFARRYTLRKTRDDGGAFTVKVDETLCMADEPAWRGALWTEVAKTILRQPGGTALMGQLKRDRDGLAGFPARFQTSYELLEPSGKAHPGKLEVTLKSRRTTEASRSLFDIPRGYEVFSPESLDLKALARQEPAKGGAPKKQEASEVESILQTAQSIFLCAISGSLGCIVSD